jgi:excisionase family DNA binding protein
MSIEERLDRIERLVIMGSKEVLNTSEVAMMLNVAVQSVRNMMYNKAIPYYKRGGKAFFKKSEIEEWMLQERIPTNDEIKSQAATYVAIKNMN